MHASSTRGPAVLAGLSAVLGLAVQVGGKAARDAFVLSRHDVATLPLLVIGASLLSIAGALLLSRLMTRHSPARLIPLAATASAGLLLVEWFLDAAAPRAIAIVVYLHLATAGGLLVSGFWSLINER